MTWDKTIFNFEVSENRHFIIEICDWFIIRYKFWDREWVLISWDKRQIILDVILRSGIYLVIICGLNWNTYLVPQFEHCPDVTYTWPLFVLRRICLKQHWPTWSLFCVLKLVHWYYLINYIKEGKTLQNVTIAEAVWAVLLC